MMFTGMFGQWLRDVRYGLRRLRQNPGFTAATVITLALGIGANTAMFSVVDSVLLRPLPYKAPQQLVVLWQTIGGSPQRVWASPGNFLDWRVQNRAFSDLAAFSPGGFTLSGLGRAERVTGASATWNAFSMLGRAPALGRSFRPEDDLPGAPRVAILSYGFWQRRFAGDPKVLGRTIEVDREPHTVIGIMPREFRFFYAPDLLTPLGLDPANATRSFEYLLVVGRLKPGVSLAQAQAEMNRVAGNLQRANPKTNQGSGVRLERARDAAVEDIQIHALWILFGAVALVLLVACVNVANLLLAKAAARQRELAVRASLGAGRGRLVGQLLVESVLLASMGGALGIALAMCLLKLVLNLVPDFAREGLAEIGVDWRVLGFTLALSLVTGLLFGVFPAWRAARLDLQATLKMGGRGGSGSFRQARFRGALVVLEVALSTVLLASAGLMLRSFAAMESINPGFRRDHILTMRLAMDENRFGPGPLRIYYQRVLEKTASLPGVAAASLSLGIPLQRAQLSMPFHIANQPKTAKETFAPFEIVTADFFRMMGIALHEGRTFTDRDAEGSPRVAIVNETFVRRYLKGEDPVGKQLLMQSVIAGSKEAGPEVPWEVVGVVAGVKYLGLDEKRAWPEIYVPMAQSPWPGVALLVRTQGEPVSVAQAARAALAEVDPEVPVTAVETMDQVVDDSLMQTRLRTWLISGFAAVALLIAALGIYALISFLVAQATHDLGVRMALGADRGDVLRLVLGRAMVLTAWGLGVGVAGALVCTRILSSLLFQVQPSDPLTLAAVSALLALVALVAGLIPALRASRIDPVVALRAE